MGIKDQQPLLFGNALNSEAVENCITLKGILKRVIFANQENGYTVCLLDLNRNQGTITITGCFPGVQCGETLVVKGNWTEHNQYGRQFQCIQFESTLPSDVHGIRQYLSSGLIHGIGKEYANKIVEFFGTETFSVLNGSYARLMDVPGIGIKRAKKIKKAWDEQKSIRDTMIFLQIYGFTNTQCLRLYQYYGEDTKRVIAENPYIIVKTIDGIGFKSADKIALNLGFKNDSDFRIDAGIEYVLSEFEGEGHTGGFIDNLIKNTSELLNLSSELISNRINSLSQNGTLSLYSKTGLLQRKKMFFYEAGIANHIQRLYCAPSHLPSIQIDQALKWSEEKLHIQWSDSQKNALRAILRSKLSVLTGGPGTGKTTLLKALVGVLSAKKVRLCLAAPTGRAAQRMSEATGLLARTVHRTLKFEPSIGRFTYDEDNLLPVDYLILDESSMLDVALTHALLRALPDHTHVLFVGDIYQLPSVGPGSVLNDFIQSPYFHVEYLSDIFRQSKRSSIVATAHNVLGGKRTLECPIVLPNTPIDLTEDFHFIQVTDPQNCMEILKDLCWHKIPHWYSIDPIRDIQILAPMHRGFIGIDQINTCFQETAGVNRRKLQIGTQHFCVGDKVIQLKNNYNTNIFNGDLGIIQAIDLDEELLNIRFDAEDHLLDRSDCLDLKLAYAISIHKSQGSEFPIVIIPLFTQHFVMLKRNLLYTAITRGRKKVFIVGDPRAYSIAVRTLDSTIRQTTLKDRLNTAFEHLKK